ncbi:hypothetical protein Tco_0271185 [Tanacetum coccineum]
MSGTSSRSKMVEGNLYHLDDLFSDRIQELLRDCLIYEQMCHSQKNDPIGNDIARPKIIGPYTPTIVTTPVVPAIEDSLAVLEQTTVETVTNMTPENRAHFESEKEAIHLILTGFGVEITNLLMHV